MSGQIPLFEKTRGKPSKVAAKVEEIVGSGFDVQKFVENFEVLAEAGRGMGPLRKLTLELAIRGDLSSRRTSDDSARALFELAHSDRIERQRRGQARQMDDLAEVAADATPFQVPASWIWTRIGLAVNLVNGRAFKPSDWSAAGLPIVRIQNLNNPKASFNYCDFNVAPKHHVGPGDFLISWSGTPGTSFGAFVWEGPKGVLNQHIFRAEVYGGAYELGFLKVAINARLDEMIAQAHGAVGLQHITKGKLEALAIPLPPLAEQKRIVAKVDQLMALCDDLEARQTKKREVGTRLTKSALEALTTAEGPEEFDAAWKRVVENFPTIVDRAEKVGELRAAIRDLAVSGRLLAPANPSGQPGLTDDVPFVSPPGWRWRKLGELARSTSYGTSQKAHEHVSGVPVLRMNNIQDGRLDLSSLKYVPSNTDKLEQLMLAPGDLLFNRTNSYELVGKMAVFRESEPYTFASYLISVRLDFASAIPEYVNVYFGSSVCRRTQIEPHITRQTNQANFNGTKLKDILVPVPSVDEQKRIVAKLEKLMKVCDDLEASLRRAEEQASRLVDAVVQELAG